MSKSSSRRKRKDLLRKISVSSSIPLKDWDAYSKQVLAEIRASERITANDLKITINCRDDD